MLRYYISLDQAVQFVNDLSDDEKCEVVVLPPENQGEVTDEGNDDKNLVKQNVGLQDVAGHLKSFHPALQVDGQHENITSKSKISKKQGKVKWRSKKEFDIQLPDNEPGTLEEQHSKLCSCKIYLVDVRTRRCSHNFLALSVTRLRLSICSEILPAFLIP